MGCLSFITESRDEDTRERSAASSLLARLSNQLALEILSPEHLTFETVIPPVDSCSLRIDRDCCKGRKWWYYVAGTTNSINAIVYITQSGWQQQTTSTNDFRAPEAETSS